MTLNILHQSVGKTRSGKTITCATDMENAKAVCHFFKEQSFSTDDFLDAFAVFEYLSVRAKRKVDFFEIIYLEHAHLLSRLLSSEQYESAIARAGITTAFELRDLARSLVGIEFKDQ